MPWCLACGARFPESLQLRLPKLQEAKLQARLADEGLWVEETCVNCGTHFRTLALRDFLGFRERECPNCHQLTVSPLSGSYRLVYWLFFGLLVFSVVARFREGIPDLLNEGALYGLLLLMALLWAISKDLKIVYHQRSFRREGNHQTPGERVGRGGEQATRYRDAPSLASRWGAGFLVLLVGWFITFWMFLTIGDLIDLLHPGEEDSSNLLFALKCGVYLILGPLIVSAYSESGLKLSQPWSFWLRGFKTLLIGALVLLPCLLLSLGAQGMIRLGGIEEGSEQARLLWLLVMFMMIVLVPFSMAPLFRWLSRSPLAEQASWVNERLSPPHSTFRGH
jgi:hypothetical protein